MWVWEMGIFSDWSGDITQQIEGERPVSCNPTHETLLCNDPAPVCCNQTQFLASVSFIHTSRSSSCIDFVRSWTQFPLFIVFNIKNIAFHRIKEHPQHFIAPFLFCNFEPIQNLISNHKKKKIGLIPLMYSRIKNFWKVIFQISFFFCNFTFHFWKIHINLAKSKIIHNITLICV